MNKITAIIPYHLDENQKYLDACIKSLKAQEQVNLEIMVISSSKQMPDVPEDVRLLHNPDNLISFASKINFGVKKARPDSKYFFVGNDDIILSKRSLYALTTFCGDSEIIVNARSNCDNGIHYFASDNLCLADSSTITLSTKMEFKEIEPYIDELINIGLREQIAIETAFLCFYGTIIPRKIWNDVGYLDEMYHTGCEDIDYCTRARKLGFKTFVNLGTYIFHFSGVTSSKIVTDEQRLKNKEYYERKWNLI